MITAEGMDLIKAFEGCHKPDGPGHVVAYRDPVGVWTIGWGTTGAGVREGLRISRHAADRLLMRDVRKFYSGVFRYSPVLMLSPDMHAAVTSFAYNLGLGAYQASTMRRMIDKGRWRDAAAQFDRWVLAGGRRLKGLVRRRAVERALFERGIR